MLSAENLQRLFIDISNTFAHLHPLGLVSVIMLGLGAAARAGLFGAAMRAAVGNTPKHMLTWFLTIRDKSSDFWLDISMSSTLNSFSNISYL